MVEYLLLPFVELEIRFGTLSKNFDTSVDKKYFNHIKDSLTTRKDVFKTIENKNTTEYINSEKNKNLKLVTSNNEKNIIMKENVLNKTFNLNYSPFDIKLSINQEFSLNTYLPSFQKNGNNTVSRKKDRTSFINENFRYDLTNVYETINSVTKQKYEIEIEILTNKETLTWSDEYLNDFIECKIYDIVNIVENVDRNKFKLKLF